MNYPKSGTKSADGKLYTHTDGSVHESVPFEGNCRHCSCRDFCDTQCHIGTMFRRIEGAFVPTDEVLEACEAMRGAIRICRYHLSLARCHTEVDSCSRCSDWSNKTCPLRSYIAKHGQADAWEVKT